MIERWYMLPLILFNIVVDMWSILIARVKEDGEVGGLIPQITILFMEHDLKNVVNMKLMYVVQV